MKLVTKAQMNKIDHDSTTLFHIPSLLLMEHAGNGVYVDIVANYDKTKRFCFVCGVGNNGGDGFVIARLLFQSGYDVAVYLVGDQTSLTNDAKINFDIMNALHVPMTTSIDGYDVIVDCLFGTGLSRDLQAPYDVLIESINNHNATVISIDIPSGVNSDTGQIYGCAIYAHTTYTMQCGKVGMYVHPARQHCGNIKVIDIHIPEALIESCESHHYLIEKEAMKQLLPLRQVHSNKGTYGKVLCIGGSASMSGAISLASKSALRAGCGLMTCAIPKGIHEVIATNVLESMLLLLEEENGFIHQNAVASIKAKLASCSTVLIGCGIGREQTILPIMEMLLKSDKPLVVDADGLVALKPYLSTYKDRKDIILTPHLKEFADLIETDISIVQKDVLHHIKLFTQQYPNYTLVVKSDTTIIAKQDTCYLNTYGNNGLAVGGSGDVLAGIITGLYAQNENVFDAARLGVFLHAFSADQLLNRKSVYNILPSDIIDTLEIVMKEL